MNTEWICARSYSPSMKENDSSPRSSMPFLVPHEWSTELEALLMVFLSLLSHCLKWRLGSILLYDKKEKKKQRGPQILIDDLYTFEKFSNCIMHYFESSASRTDD